MPPLLPLLGLFALADPQTGVDGAVPLFDPWLRHEAVVIDVEWYGDGRLVTLDAAATITGWRLDERTVGIRSTVEGVVEIETAVDDYGAPLGLVLAYGGEAPRIEFRESSDRPPAWTVEGLRGPIAIGPNARRLVANDGERLVFVDLTNGERSVLFELDGFSVDEVRFGGDELAVLLVNGPKQLGLPGTEFEAAAILSVLGIEQRDRRVLESYAELPTHLARLGGRWVAIDERGRLISGSAERAGAAAELFETPILCAGPGGDALLAVGIDGRLRRAVGVPGGLEVRGFVGVGARELERSPDGSLYALADGTTVRLIDAEGVDRGGATGPAAQVSALEFGPDGERLLLASYDHTVRLVRVDGGLELAREPAVGIVHAAVALPDPALDGFAWVARGGRLEARVEGSTGPQRFAAEDPGLAWTDLAAGSDGLYAALADGQLIRFDPRTLRRRWTTVGAFGARPVAAAAGEHLVVGGAGLAHLAAADGSVRGRIPDLGAPVERIALAGDGRRGALGLADGSVRIFRLDGPPEEGAAAGTSGAGASRDGASRDGAADAGAAQDGAAAGASGRPNLVGTVAGHRGRISGLALTADGAWLASIGTGDDHLVLTRLDAEGRPDGSTALPWSGPPCSALAWWTPPGAAADGASEDEDEDEDEGEGEGVDEGSGERSAAGPVSRRPARLLAAGRTDGTVVIHRVED